MGKVAMMNTVLGIDVGTTGTKTMLMDEHGKVLGLSSKGYPLYTPGIGLCEQNADDWWNAIIETVRAVCDTEDKARSVRGISLSTQGGTVVPVDKDFRPLANAIVWSDTRCSVEKRQFETIFGDYVYRKSGWNLSSGLPLLQLFKMRNDAPDLFNKAYMFLTVPDFVAARLTGKPAVDISNAGINQFADITAGKYDSRLMDFIGISEDRLAPIGKSGSVVGKLTHEAASLLGLNDNVIASLGAHDQYAVALGVGICDAGDAVIGSGTAWVVTSLSDKPNFETRYSQSHSASENSWGTILSITTGGVCLDWFRKQVAGSEDESIDYAEVNRMAMQNAQPGSGGLRFYPYFSGAGQPEPDNCSKATFLGLDLSHGRGQIMHAIMEGVSFQIIWALRRLEQHSPIKRLVLTGGATKSSLWTQMLTDIADRPVYVPEVTDPACVGAAMMAGVGCGLFRDTKEAVQRLKQPETAHMPDKENAQSYKSILDSYICEARMIKNIYSRR